MSDEEKKAIERDEPTSPYTELTVKGISTGRQSTVRVVQFDSEPNAIVIKRMGVGKKLTLDEATTFLERLRPYRWALRRSGWNVPKLFHTHVDVADNGEAHILSFEEYIGGGDGDYSSRSSAVPNYKKWFTIRSAVEILANYSKDSLSREIVSGRQVTKLPHGLDLKLANLVVGNDNRLYFIDLFGPKELRSDGEWLNYSTKLDSIAPEKLKAVTATREGAILRLLRLAEDAWVESGSISVEDFRQQVPALLRESQVPSVESAFIADEVASGYPWLRELYDESSV